MQHCIIDRLEGGVAVCELKDKTMADIPLADLPEGVREGDCLTREDGVWMFDQERAGARKARISKLADSLFAD